MLAPAGPQTPVWTRLPLPLMVVLKAPVTAGTDSWVIVLVAAGLTILRMAPPVFSVTAPRVRPAVPPATRLPPVTVNWLPPPKEVAPRIWVTPGREDAGFTVMVPLAWLR